MKNYHFAEWSASHPNRRPTEFNDSTDTVSVLFTFVPFIHSE